VTDGQTDGQTDTGRQQRPRSRIASRGKTIYTPQRVKKSDWLGNAVNAITRKISCLHLRDFDGTDHLAYTCLSSRAVEVGLKT